MLVVPPAVGLFDVVGLDPCCGWLVKCKPEPLNVAEACLVDTTFVSLLLATPRP